MRLEGTDRDVDVGTEIEEDVTAVDREVEAASVLEVPSVEVPSVDVPVVTVPAPVPCDVVVV